MKTRLNLALLGLAFVLMLDSCGGNSAKKTTQSQPIESQPASTAEGTVSNVLSLEGNDQMQYSKNELTATAGKTITLTFKHTGTLDKAVMGHNFILLKPGTDINAFAQKAIEAKATDYIPKSEVASIIAHTKLIGGGESDTITFEIKDKGTYDFICSFPGHVAMMKGKLIVQ